ncbi:RNA ligase RtcB family protein [Marinibactrum halimedae]|nr:RNA ligase RtcB family protein [Marinibactrum halimedae]MCD9458859.1 RNA ligase RtcB family protein [Marinibactrum halimedae]
MGNSPFSPLRASQKLNNGALVNLVISEKNWLETTAVDQLIHTTQLPGMLLGVGMPDLHPGKGQPIGAAFISQEHIYPHLVGSDIGCGMGLWHLDVPAHKFKMDKIEKRLVGLDEPYEESPNELLEQYDFDLSAFDRMGIENIDALNNKLGTIGGGNHFAEFQSVAKIFDSDVFEQTGLTKRSTVLLVHSGSRGLGQAILHQHMNSHGANSLTGSTQNGYLHQHDTAVKWAEINRYIIARRFLSAIKAGGHSILDITHNSVTALSSQQQNDMISLCAPLSLTEKSKHTMWIHRKGVSPTDQGLVMIPGSRGSHSYLVKPKTDNKNAISHGGYSLAHGAGRKWQRSDAKGKLRNNFTVKDLENNGFGGRVICKQRDLLFEEAPQAYKNIDVVISDLQQAGMIDLIAQFKPLLTYKTRKK